MRLRLILLTVTMGLALALFAVGCGNGGSGFGGDGGVDGDLDATFAPDNQFNFGDGGVGEAGCVGLQCQQTCASTSISGTVYDPASLVPLYNVFVYVPNTGLDPIPDGPTCTQCQAPASGNPVVSATTDANGKFTIPNAPDGANIPIVLQLGKWRRHLTIANVTKCVDNPQPDKSLRLPKKQHESSPDDNIPLIALTTGCDGAECFFSSRVGIDQSEFTGSNGTGRVRVYKSTNDDGQTFPKASGGMTAQQLWDSKTEMMKYDIIFDACECSTFTRGTNGYANYLAYLNAGGRAFATHFFYNFFASTAQCGGFDATCQGPAPLPTVGAWEANQGLPYAAQSNCPKTGLYGGYCLNIDTQIPKGKAFADWYKANNTKINPAGYGSETYGYVNLTDIRNDMGKLSASLLSAGTATPWLYAGDVKSNYDAYYFSFNTPVGTNPQTQCGRAIFSDVHLAESPFGAFPSYCATDPDTGDHAPNELALEFLFFDLASCVQNDTQAPVVPH